MAIATDGNTTLMENVLKMNIECSYFGLPRGARKFENISLFHNTEQWREDIMAKFNLPVKTGSFRIFSIHWLSMQA